MKTTTQQGVLEVQYKKPMQAMLFDGTLESARAIVNWANGCRDSFVHGAHVCTSNGVGECITIAYNVADDTAARCAYHGMFLVLEDASLNAYTEATFNERFSVSRKTGRWFTAIYSIDDGCERATFTCQANVTSFLTGNHGLKAALEWAVSDGDTCIDGDVFQRMKCYKDAKNFLETATVGQRLEVRLPSNPTKYVPEYACTSVIATLTCIEAKHGDKGV